MDDIKQRSVASCKLWKSAGKPRSGYIYDISRKDKAAYKSSIRKKQREEKEIHTNDLSRGPSKQTRTSILEMLVIQI